jgi:hypothetical protein
MERFQVSKSMRRFCRVDVGRLGPRQVKCIAEVNRSDHEHLDLCIKKALKVCSPLSYQVVLQGLGKPDETLAFLAEMGDGLCLSTGDVNPNINQNLVPA